jgi:hypothetical protein
MAFKLLSLPLMCGILLVYTLYRIFGYIQFNSKYRFPNHVSGRLPLLGNMLQIPKHPAEQRLHFADLAKRYGEM